MIFLFVFPITCHQERAIFEGKLAILRKKIRKKEENIQSLIAQIKSFLVHVKDYKPGSLCRLKFLITCQHLKIRDLSV